MVPLRSQAPDWVLKADEAPHRSTALRHAALHDRPSLWGDDPDHPSSALWLREADEGNWEAFGAGRPEPAIGWLADRMRGRSVVLLAPPSWEGPVRRLGGRIEMTTIVTLLRPASPAPPTSKPSKVLVRPLDEQDAIAFESTAPPWALRSWGDFGTMISRGLAFGVPMAGGFAALAWTYESDPEHDKVGVTTAPRFRNLGLGTVAASALVDHIVQHRRKSPLWVTNPTNPASIALARSLGFSLQVEETSLHWTPRH